MLSSALRTRKLRVRSGVAAARSRIAGRSSRHRRQRRARERPQLVADDRRRRRSGTGASRAATARARAPPAAGPRASVPARRPSGRRWPAPSATRRASKAAPAASRGCWRSWLASAANTAFELSTKLATCVSRLPSSSISSEKLWIDAPQVLPPQRELLVDPAGVAGGRLEAPDRLRQRAAVALQADRGVAEQQLQVVARVGVERGEDLVEVDVRAASARPGSARPRPARRPPGVPGLSSATMSLRPVLGRIRMLASR